jgi:hypothetical protein
MRRHLLRFPLTRGNLFIVVECSSGVEINMAKDKCAMCGVVLDDECDVVYGLHSAEMAEFLFCSRFCRDMFSHDLKFAEHKKYEANRKA